MLHIRRGDDVGLQGTGVADRCMSGCRKAHYCAELVLVSRTFVEQNTSSDWSSPWIVAQVDFACAHDSVLLSAVVHAMTRRGVPEPVVAVYVRDLRNTNLVFKHGLWRTKGIQPTVGLRQGHSLSPYRSLRWLEIAIMRLVGRLRTGAGLGMGRRHVV